MSHVVGGHPYNRQYAVDSDGYLNGGATSGDDDQDAFQQKIVTPARTTWMAIQTDQPVKVYWTKESFDDDVNYITVSDSLSGPFAVKAMWIKAVSTAANVQIIFVGEGPV